MSAPGRSRSLHALAFAALVGVAGSALTADGRTDDPRPPTPATAPAQITDFTNPRYVIANGGGSSSGGSFAISGTIGQADADPLQPSTGGTFAITGGFWGTAAAQTDGLFEDGFEDP